MKLISLFVVATLGACGGSQGSSSTPAPTPPTSNAGDVLALAELTFYEDNEPGLRLHSNGELEMRYKRFENGQKSEGWRKVAVLAANGTMTSTEGKTAQIMADGTVKGDDKSEQVFTWDGETLVLEGKRITIDDKGVLLVDGQPSPNGKTMRVEGAIDARTRRTALTIMGLMFGGGKARVHSESSVGEAPPSK